LHTFYAARERRRPVGRWRRAARLQHGIQASVDAAGVPVGHNIWWTGAVPAPIACASAYDTGMKAARASSRARQKKQANTGV
jgi:hypothetical protein